MRSTWTEVIDWNMANKVIKKNDGANWATWGEDHHTKLNKFQIHVTFVPILDF